jgi:hypothetical protein
MPASAGETPALHQQEFRTPDPKKNATLLLKCGVFTFNLRG